MKILLSSLLFLAPLGAFAYTPKTYQPTYFCPTAHSAYKNALNKLKELKSSLSNLECGEINLEIDKISELNDSRTEIVDIVSKNEDGILSGSDAQKLQEYTTKATQTAASIIDMAKSAGDKGLWESLFGQSSCKLDETHRFEVISKASSVVYDATQLASKVAGPYGVPIAIGGSILSGVLEGVSLFMQNRNHIDFTDESKRLFYAESLCLYHQFDLEIDQIMNPQSQEEIMSLLQNHLNSIMETLNQDCQSDLLACGNKVQNLMDSFSDYRGEDESEEFLSAQKDLIEELNEYSIDLYGEEQKWGSLIANTLLDLQWTNNEIERFSSILNHPSDGIEKGEVQVLRNRVTTFFKDTANEELIKWYLYTELPKRVSEFEKSVKQIPIYLIDTNYDAQKVYRFYSAEKVFEYIFENYDKLQKSRAYASAVLDAYNEWKALEERFASFSEYCRFFDDSLMVTLSTQNFCQGVNNRNMDRMRSLIARGSFSLAFLVQDPYFPKRDTRTTFDFSLSRYVNKAAGLPVRKETAVKLGPQFFEEAADVKPSSDRPFFTVASLDRINDILSDPIGGGLEAAVVAASCDSPYYNWQESITCRIELEADELRTRNQD